MQIDSLSPSALDSLQGSVDLHSFSPFYPRALPSSRALERARSRLKMLDEEAKRLKDIQPRDKVPLVDMATFLDSPDYAGAKDLVWPGVKEDLIAMSQPGILGAIIEQGIGGGKSYRIAYKLAYDIYRIAYEEVILGVNPRPRFSLDPDAMISAATVSRDAKNAKRVVFGYISTIIDRSPWFQEYLPRNKRINSELQFKLPYSVFPGHSHQNSVIGLNLLVAIIDEANFFVVSESSGGSGIDYVEDMYDAIESRIRSRFGLDGFIGVISSRRTVRDFTARKRTSLLGDPASRKSFYLPDPRTAWHDWPLAKSKKWLWKPFDGQKALWCGDPVEFEDLPDGAARATATRSVSFYVPETLWGAFGTNPEGAMRDHASLPSEAIEPFIRRRDLIVPEWTMHNPVLPSTDPQDWMSPGVRFDDLVSPDFYGSPNEVYHFHVDLARKWDACGISVAHCSGAAPVATSDSERRPEKTACVDIDILIQIKAPPNGEIDFATVRRILYWLRDERGFRFKDSSYDGYESADSKQVLVRRGFIVEIFSLDKNLEGYSTLKDALYEGRLFFPPAHGQTPDTTIEQLRYMAQQGDPCAVFQVELAELEFINNKKVDHPAHGSKDVADAGAGAVTHAAFNIRRVASGAYD